MTPIRHNKYSAEFKIQNHYEVRSGLIVYFKLFSAAGHFMKNPPTTVCLQDPIMVLGNMCLRQRIRNLQGTMLYQIFKHLTADQILNKTQSTTRMNTLFNITETPLFAHRIDYVRCVWCTDYKHLIFPCTHLHNK